MDVVDKDGKPLPDTTFSVKSSQCTGECDTFDGTAFAIKLPRNTPFRLVVKAQDGSDATKPGWDEAQLVAYR